MKTRRLILLKNSSSLSTSLRRLQQLSLQEDLRQLVQRIRIPPVHRSQRQSQQACRLLQRKLLQRNPPDQVLLSFVELLTQLSTSCTKITTSSKPCTE